MITKTPTIPVSTINQAYYEPTVSENAPRPYQTMQLQTARIISDKDVRHASMHSVVMKKEDLLNALTENKAKHDAIFANAILGYWEEAKLRINEKHKEILSAINTYKKKIDFEFDLLNEKIINKEVPPATVGAQICSWNTNLGISYPENHTDDYERAIRMTNMSIYDTVELSEDEFDSYVLNNWEWKKRFLISNSAYLSNIKGRGPANLGVAGSNGPTGAVGAVGRIESYTSTFNKFSNDLADSASLEGRF
jgi:hypothetical protein